MAVIDHAVVVGVYAERAPAQQAVEELIRVGFPEDQIGIVARDSSPRKASPWEEGAATGAVTGAGMGALWGLAVAAGMLPVGPVIAGGLFVSMLAGAAEGAAVGG